MKKVFRALLALLCAAAVLAAVFVGTLTALEYRPADAEELEIGGAAVRTLCAGENVRVLSWNVGYGALGDNADFFMDGGTMVTTADEARVLDNVGAMIDAIAQLDPDIVLLQETDRSSSRSHRIDETELFAASRGDTVHTFANNFKAAFVPYPLPPIGKVDSGLLTLSAYPIREATRVSLPCPFSWPVRTVNLKRCLSVSRIPVEDSGSELVLVNLHLEAYDDGAGKAAQLRMLNEVLTREVEAGNYVVAGGDFNHTRADVIERWPLQEGVWAPGVISDDELSDGLLMLMDAAVPTCRSLDRPYEGINEGEGHDYVGDGFQYYVIDGFIVSSNVEVRTLRTVDLSFAATDHNPVLLELVLK